MSNTPNYLLLSSLLDALLHVKVMCVNFIPSIGHINVTFDFFQLHTTYYFFTGLSIPRISRDRNNPPTSLFQKIFKDRTVQRIFKNIPKISLGNGRRIANSRPNHPIKGIFFQILQLCIISKVIIFLNFTDFF